MRAAVNLHDKCSFPNDVKIIGAMLIAHARRCQACFGASRRMLGQLGFDEETMDGMCAHLDALPISEKNRAFVQFALKVATTPAADLTAKDSSELTAAGLSREEVQEAIGFAVYWVMNTIFNSAALVALNRGVTGATWPRPAPACCGRTLRLRVPRARWAARAAEPHVTRQR